MIKNLTREEVAILIQSRKICNINNIPKSIDVKSICQAVGISRKTVYQWVNKMDIKLKEREIYAYNFRDNNDYSEHLKTDKKVKGLRFSPKQKLKIYHDFIKSFNRAALARECGMDRSYLYQLAGLYDQILIDYFCGQKPGRKSKNKTITIEDVGSNTIDLEIKNEKYAFQNTSNQKFKWHIKKIPNADQKILEQWRKSNDKRIWAKAVTIIDSRRLSLEEISFKIEQPIKKIKNWIKVYHQNGIYGLADKRGKRDVRKSEEIGKTRTKRIMEILHQNPKTYGINRSNWTRSSMSTAYERKYGKKISKSSIGILLKNSGYSLKKARNVLKSFDPNYREKVELVLNTLWSLQPDDMFFFIDELGPLRVKKYGGRCYTKKGETVTIPQNPSSKGSITLYGALSATTNQVTWNFGKSKDTSAMIDLIEILFNQYYNKSKIYITWDVASWHRSNQLVEWLDVLNAETKKMGQGPIIELVPLPSCSQFLDVIEAVFSAMKKAVILH